MNLRIQTWGKRRFQASCSINPGADICFEDNVNVMEVLRKALDDLSDLCDVVEEKFIASRDQFKATNPDGLATR